LRYLKGVPGKGLYYHPSPHLDIVKYYNVDWVSDPIDRRSTTGYCNFVGVYLVTWRCKKQNVVARSSAEAEYKVMAHTACDLM